MLPITSGAGGVALDEVDARLHGALDRGEDRPALAAFLVHKLDHTPRLQTKCWNGLFEKIC